MRRTPLVRRSSLRRSTPRPWFRDEDDKVTPELHDYIIRRDRTCIAARYDPEHDCRDRFGNRHLPNDTKRLTLDHVPGEGQNAMGKRAPSDRRHLVAVCGDANNNGWCSANRDIERAYLAEAEP